MFAETPKPPYTAVIFTARRTVEDQDGFEDVAAQMGPLAARQAGYLGIETVEDPSSRMEITVSYWSTDEDARAWKAVSQHSRAQRMGRERWYERYEVRVASVGRAYGHDANSSTVDT